MSYVPGNRVSPIAPATYHFQVRAFHSLRRIGLAARPSLCSGRRRQQSSDEIGFRTAFQHAPGLPDGRTYRGSLPSRRGGWKMTMSISRCLADWDWTSSHFLSTRAAKAAPSPGTLESLDRSHHGLAALRMTNCPKCEVRRVCGSWISPRSQLQEVQATASDWPSRHPQFHLTGSRGDDDMEGSSYSPRLRCYLASPHLSSPRLLFPARSMRPSPWLDTARLSVARQHAV
ncbi:hypothetical protein BKA56DRAFT_274430 [Ilyonectria sp. MPI-CAGE-AT-0026]|nr:hypothetical protein BKA56DRAFT_274430 [Ilyonectria sp. MPI-CAGE-AT-0026]